MRSALALGLIWVGLATLPPELHASDDVRSATVARLCEQVKGRKVLLVDRTRPEVVWSDGAIFEVARTFPAELEKLLTSPTGARDMQPLIERFMGDLASGAQDAKITRTGRGEEPAVIESADGTLQLHLASPYAEYLSERYPRAQIRIRGPLAPIVFLVDGSFRACVMPMARPQ